MFVYSPSVHSLVLGEHFRGNMLVKLIQYENMCIEAKFF